MITRLLHWNQQKQLKLKQARALKRKTATEDCTFQPTVSDMQLYTSDDWRTTRYSVSAQTKKTYKYSKSVPVVKKRHREMESPVPTETSWEKTPSLTTTEEVPMEVTQVMEKLGEELKSL